MLQREKRQKKVKQKLKILKMPNAAAVAADAKAESTVLVKV
jgi:hypothetical protein